MVGSSTTSYAFKYPCPTILSLHPFAHLYHAKDSQQLFAQFLLATKKPAVKRTAAPNKHQPTARKRILFAVVRSLQALKCA